MRYCGRPNAQSGHAGAPVAGAAGPRRRWRWRPSVEEVIAEYDQAALSVRQILYRLTKDEYPAARMIIR